MLSHAVQITDPFHVVKLANFVLDEVRRWVQNGTLGHRGRRTDPFYRCGKLTTLARETSRRYGERETGRAARG
jgi:transposase